MRSIYFRFDKEVIYFCEMLYRLQNEIHLKWKKDKHWGNELQIDQTFSVDMIISCFVEVFIYFRLNEMIKNIIQNKFYYSDIAEIDKICELTSWVISEKEYQTKLFFEQQSIKQFIFTNLNQNVIDHVQIHFDSLITFCMKPLNERLLIAVGYAIDEMKREEDYQNYIQTIREFIEYKKPKCKALYILQGEQFSFYRSNGTKYTMLELKTLMHHEPLYIFGLDEDEMNLSPVITLLPEKIYIYGDDPSEAKTLTLINIFQEKVHFFPKNHFPFSLHIK